MKIIEANINDLDNIGKTLKAIVAADKFKRALADLVEDERYHSADGLMFLSGLHLGYTFGVMGSNPHDVVVELSNLDFKIAGIAKEALGEYEFETVFSSAAGAFEETIKESLDIECDCPECRAKREAEEE